MYPGSFKELAVQNHYTDIEIHDCLRRYVQYQLQPYYGLCQFEFFIGKENYHKARKRADELFTNAHKCRQLPKRFYENQTTERNPDGRKQQASRTPERTL